MLSAFIHSLGSSSPSLSDVRLVASSLLSFAVFLCYDERAKLQCCDITFSVDSMTVRIRSSKTDQYQQGDTVLVARTGSPTRPVAMLEQYLELGELSNSLSLGASPTLSQADACVHRVP